jgi:hypothetical protein
MSQKSDKPIPSSPKPDANPAGDGPADAKSPPADTLEVTRDDMHSSKSLARDIEGVSAPSHVSNARRSRHRYQLLAVALISSMVSAATVGLWTRSWWVEQRLTAPSGTAKVPSATAPGDTSSSARLARLDAQVIALQEQLDAWRRDQLLGHQELRESIERLSAAGTGATQTLVPTSPGASTAAREGLADMSIQVTPTQREFIQLKERNRLTAYADEVIATGLRKPLETLVEYMRDPSAADLHEAATAEYLRAVRAIQTLQREDPGYRLPVAELFKDSGMRNEADLKPDALFKLLDDVKQPWEVRLRAAILLKGSDAKETNARLIKVIKEDPSLDVAKHAQICLEQRVGRRFRMFDIPAIEAWWAAQGNG